MWIALFACTAPGPTPPDSPAPGDSPPVVETGRPGETGESSPCPEGFVHVGDADQAGAFCIFAFEASVEDGHARSVEGVVPEIGMTFYEARAYCEAEGWTLATSTQWQDAADGVVGEGGTNYPYGDEVDDDACATPSSSGQVVYDELQPTGSLPDCVSAFGAYDQSGNAFEWADPQHDVDIAAFLAANPQLGEATSGDLTTTDVELTVYKIAGVTSTPSTDADGVLIFPIDPMGWEWEFSNATGYVEAASGGLDGLPVEAVPTDEAYTTATLRVRRDEDGTPRTDKRGGAFYAGNASSSQTHLPFTDHVPEFSGTVTFRCASTPD